LGNTVTVNGVTAVDRKAEFFHATAGANNAASPLWLNVAVSGAGNNVSGHQYVAQEPEHFQYDADGNLTNDGRYAYFWDAENRLVAMTNNTSVGPVYNLTFAYDAKGRRIQKTVVSNNVLISTVNFLYDGWNLVAELGANNSLIRNYVWGTDLSGSQQGAGGVGGLLEVTYHGNAVTNAFVAFDGNGNVTALVNAGDGTVVGNYEYGPFGEVIRNSGPLARNVPFRFSTKYQDDESDLVYYGYRYYKASTGTWLNRDPLGDFAFYSQYITAIHGREQLRAISQQSLNDPYAFSLNDSVDKVDSD
jgi:RHS repeat-associated protein